MAPEVTVLPKGIVHNKYSVYDDIARHDVIPVELILKALNVFSTTSRELYDPTARRLENFWRRVLGGDRRYLPGKVIARLFKDISETSFVKLQSPHNRYEPPSPKTLASTSDGVQATPLTPALKPKEETPTSSAKSPHPILKKPRGPSASKPRPTARFVSPPESGNDEDSTKQSGTTTPTVAAIHGVSSKDAGSSTTKDERKKGQPHKLKKKTAGFVAASSRRRPTAPRRSSSQSSAGPSEPGAKEGDLSSGTKHDGLHTSVPTVQEKPEQPQANTRKGKENTLSAKAAGKRPMVQPRAEKMISKSGVEWSSQPQNEAPPAEQGSTEMERQKLAQSRREEKAAGSIENCPKKLSPTSVQKHSTQQYPYSESFPSMIRSSSDVGSSRPTSREISRTLVPPSSLMSSTLAKVDTSVIGQARMAGFTDNIPRPSAATTSQPSVVSPVDRRMTPTQPSDKALIPLGRSKSQLTIILDRTSDKKSRR
ncbi:hypothetical protein GGS24DRAFT_50290 [Hypoxylon argillaceum]|nr:hypothetical protein GGS24DRAFT_50290 [Hypoxylon argillaceum]